MKTPDQLKAEIAELTRQLHETEAHQPQTREAEAPEGAAPVPSGPASPDDLRPALQGSTAGPEPESQPRTRQPDAIQPNPAGTPTTREGEDIGRETGEGETDILLPPLPIQQHITGQLPSLTPELVESGATVSRTRTGQFAATDAEIRMETVLEVCRRIAEGESLRTIAKDADMPTAGTFLRWCYDDAEFGQMYTVALRIRAANMAEELTDLADEAKNATEAHEVAAYKLRVNTRQWVASRLLPKQYGDHQIVEHTGEVKVDEKQIDSRLQMLMGRILTIKQATDIHQPDDTQ